MLSLSESLKSKLREMGRISWVQEVLEELYNPTRFEVDPQSLYLGIRRAATLDRRQLAVLRELCVWREQEAQRADRPRRSIATDECLIELAKRQPSQAAQLWDMRGLARRYQREGAPELLEAIRRGRQTPQEELPPEINAPKQDPEIQNAAELLLAFVKARGRQIGIAPCYLASWEEIQKIVEAFSEKKQLPQVKALEGWRFECVGRDLIKLLSGEAYLEIVGGKVKLALKK